MADNNIMRVEYQGLLHRYVPETFLKRAHWKEGLAVLYANNAMLYLHKDDSVKSKVVAELDLKLCVLWMAFGQDAYKYRTVEPKWSPQNESMEKLLADNLIAIPKDKNGDQVTWLAAKDQSTLRQWIRHFANCLKVHSNPPMLSNRRGEEERVKREVVENFGLTGCEEEWEIYWLYNAWQAEQKFQAENYGHQVHVDEIFVLEKQGGNLTEFGAEKLDPRSTAENLAQRDQAIAGCDKEFRFENQSNGQISYHVTKLGDGWEKTEIFIDVGAQKFGCHKSEDSTIDVQVLRKYAGNLYDEKRDFHCKIPTDSHITHTHMVEKISKF